MTLLGLGLVLGLGLPVGPAAEARGRPVPTAEARRAGVRPGNAYLGWRNAHVKQRTAYRPADRVAGVRGIDVASYQGNVDWRAQARAGKRFAYVKATEGTSYRNPYFASQYGGAARAGFIRGAYHFANPAGATGAQQADYFVANGGGWRPNGQTLPGVLDVEYNPYGSICYGLSDSAMVSFIRSFTTRYYQRTGRQAVIYTTLDWWRQCTGNSTAFRATNPLWIARWASSVGTLPGGWSDYTFWQYSDTPIDQDRFRADYYRLRIFAAG